MINNKTILILGSSGILGFNLFNYFREKNNVIGSSFYKRPSFIQCDITKKTDLYNIFRSVRPDIVILCAAMSSPQQCENQAQRANLINHIAVGTVAKFCHDYRVFLVHISTDHIFDGKKGNYSERDKPNPICVYGETKLLGEYEIPKYLERDKYIILRPTLIYGKSFSRKRGADEVIGLSLKEKGYFEAFVDDIRCPVLVNDISLALSKLLTKKKTGVYHLGGSQKITRYEFAIKYAEIYGFDTSKIIPIKIEDKLDPKKRPYDLSLNIEKVKKTIKIEFHNIEDGLRMVKNER